MRKSSEMLFLQKRPDAEKPVQKPSDAFNERQKQFAQQETRLAGLRDARLAAEKADKAEPTIRSYDVVRYRGSWRVQHLGKHSPACASQEAAIAAAVDKARSQAALGHAVQARLNRTDGQIVPIDLESGALAVSAPDVP